MNDYLPYITDSLNGTLAGLSYIYPETCLVGFFLLVIFAELFLSKRIKSLPFLLTVAGIGLTLWLSVLQITIADSRQLFGGMVVLSRSAVYFKILFLSAALLFVLFVRFNMQLQQHIKGTGDLYAVVWAVLLGMNCMAMSANLLMVYLSVEMVSVGSYIMVGYVSASNRQAEASMKYALFGASCSAIMLYGISLLYAFTGTLNLGPQFLSELGKMPALSVNLAMTLILVGIGFKLSFVPLHFWSPDVYEGAPTPVTALLSTGSKMAGFALLWRILEVFSPYGHGFILFDFRNFIAVVSIATMIAGNFSAIWQDNIKRMLAYSSIGHTGFLMMALSDNTGDFKSIVFYLFVYLLMNMAAFMLADEIEKQTGTASIAKYRGLGRQLPLTFLTLVIVLVSLTGLPPTAGFVAKFLVFSSALELYNFSGSSIVLWMMITGAVTTVVSLFYYFKIPLNAYLRQNEIQCGINEKKSFQLGLCIFIAALLLLFGLFPQVITELI